MVQVGGSIDSISFTTHCEQAQPDTPKNKNMSHTEEMNKNNIKTTEVWVLTVIHYIH